jgi:hypothetical protein
VTDLFVPVLFSDLVAKPKFGLVAVITLSFLLESLSLHYPLEYDTQNLLEEKLWWKLSPLFR